jgi:hypothetical protein
MMGRKKTMYSLSAHSGETAVYHWGTQRRSRNREKQGEEEQGDQTDTLPLGVPG